MCHHLSHGHGCDLQHGHGCENGKFGPLHHIRKSNKHCLRHHSYHDHCHCHGCEYVNSWHSHDVWWSSKSLHLCPDHAGDQHHDHDHENGCVHGGDHHVHADAVVV